MNHENCYTTEGEKLGNLANHEAWEKLANLANHEERLWRNILPLLLLHLLQHTSLLRTSEWKLNSSTPHNFHVVFSLLVKYILSILLKKMVLSHSNYLSNWGITGSFCLGSWQKYFNKPAIFTTNNQWHYKFSMQR